VPSDSVNGNFLEAINTTLNLLDKHYMDRLTLYGNSTFNKDIFMAEICSGLEIRLS